jgi:hypothetical protein
MIPANTPVRLPRSVVGSIPARSMASQAVSSSSRCCGSAASLARGDAEELGVEPVGVVEEAAVRTYVVPVWSGSGS